MKLFVDVRFPAGCPIEIFEAGKPLFVIVRERFPVGIAWIVIVVTASARILDRAQHHEYTDTSLRFLGIKDGVDGRRRALANVEKSYAKKLIAQVYAELKIGTWHRGGIG